MKSKKDILKIIKVPDMEGMTVNIYTRLITVREWMGYIETREQAFELHGGKPEWPGVASLLLLDLIEDHMDDALGGDIQWETLVDSFLTLNFGPEILEQTKSEDTTEKIMTMLYSVFDFLMTQGHDLESIKEYTIPDLIRYQTVICDRFKQTHGAPGPGANRKETSPDSLFSGLSSF